MTMLNRTVRTGFALSLVCTSFASTATAASSPAQEAVDELRQEKHVHDIVQNRFFLKSNRFELAPVLGYVPNNPFSRRYTGGVFLGYHLSEVISVEGAILYSPDLGRNDLKGLTSTLVAIAHSGDASGNFQQPVDKMIFGATFAAKWAPVYGKINLLGEKVLNFDFYGTAGLGLLTIQEYYATYNEDWETDGEGSYVDLIDHEKKSRIPINLGVGFDFFLNQTVALKLDARSFIYIDDKPNYDPDIDSGDSGEKRVYNNFIASAGIAIFIPKMKPRLFDF